LAAATWLALGASPVSAACSADLAELRWDGGSARFRVEVADDEAERAQGLMFRESLAASAGMLFIYPEAQPVAFWMKNTLIPLDMLFFDDAGRLVKLHENAVPGDLSAIPGEGRVRMVLEINGGLSRRIGVKDDAELRHPRLDPATAAWACDAP
jgi:uncharacterized membrane protein (UPF0127 family)